MKKTLYSIFITLLLGFTTKAQVLNVPTIEQEQDLWCWAGLAKSALDYYGEVHDQCEIAEWTRTVSNRNFGNTPCCENPTGPCNNVNAIYNEPGSIQDILFHFAGITSEYKGNFGRTEADLANAIARNAVVPCGWNFYSGAGHAVLAHGYVNGNVYYMDPWFGEGKKIATYGNFSNGDDGHEGGGHIWTQGLYFTSDVSQVDTIPCATPIALSVSNVDGNSVSLSWALEASAQSYSVRFRELGTSTWSETSASGNSKAINNLSPETTYEFQVASICNSVSESDFSASLTATTLEGPLVYCNSKGNSVAGEWIRTVSFGSINNTSNANGGYADFTAQSTSITAGTSANITLTPGFPSNFFFGTTTQPERWSVWIDLNQDGDFTDANEQRFVSTSSSTVAVTASISIPSGTMAGTTRMRIAMKRSSAASSCETFANGEVEDYSVTIIEDVPPTCDVVSGLQTSNISHNGLTASWSAATHAASYNLDIRAAGGSWSTVNTSNTSYTFSGLSEGTTYEVRVATLCGFDDSDYSSTVSATTSAAPTCDAPTGLSVSSISQNSANVSWSNVSGSSSFVLEYKESSASSWIALPTSATNLLLSGLNAETEYSFRVTTDCNGLSSAASTVATFTTEAAPEVVEYCDANGTSNNEWIQAISIGSISNTSNANGGYADFTNLSTSLEAGSSATLSITPGFPYSWLFGYTTQPEFYSVWLDINQDGDFTDAGEQLYVSPTSTSAFQAFNVTLNIPANATLGETRMRIAMKRSSAANPCGSYSFGEVEDYTVNIISSLGGANSRDEINTSLEKFNSRIFPNPSKNTTTVEATIPANSGTVVMTMIDINGKVVVQKNWASSENTQDLNEKIQVSEMPKGLYFIQITSEKGFMNNHKLLVE